MSFSEGVEQIAVSLRRRPALPMAVALIAGIACYRALPVAPGIWIAVAAALLLAAVAMIRSHLGTVLILLSIFFCGLGGGQLREFYFSADHIGLFTPEEPRLARMELRVIETPKIFYDSFARMHHSAEHQSVMTQALRIETRDGWRDCRGSVALHLSYPLDELRAGQTVRVLGYLERPPPAMNPGQFDWAERRREERGLATLIVPHPQHVTILTSNSPSVLSMLRDRTRSALAAGFADPRSLDLVMLRALLLGDSDPQLREVRAAFQHTGTAHLLAISGLHVVVVWAFVALVCRVLRTPPMIAVVITSVVVVLYGFSALPSTPAERAVALCLAATLAMAMRRGVDSVQLLSAICFAMLVVDPLAMFSPGFQLSFACVLGLMSLQRRIAERIRGLRDRDVEIAHSFRPARGWAAVTRWLRGHFEEALAGAIVAWAISIPIVETHFNQLNIWSIPCALLLAPFTFLAIVAGLLKIALTMVLPWFASIWALIPTVAIRVLRDLAETLAKIPGSDFPLRTPPRWVIAVYFVALALAFVPAAKVYVKHATRSVAMIVLLIVGLFPFLVGASDRGRLKVTVLSVGNGRCIVVQAPGADPVMIDAGSARVPELEYGVIAPFLRSEGIGSIGWLILSDGDYDDINAAGDVVRDYSPRRVLCSGELHKVWKESYAARREVSDLDATGPTLQPLGKDQQLAIDTGATTLEVLWPPTPTALHDHDCGLVLKLNYAGKSILFPANIEVAAEKELLKHPERLKADVLVAPHHGTVDALTREFVAAVNPSVVISSNSSRMTARQKELNEVVKERRLQRTDTSGAITITVDRAGEVEVTPFLRPG